MKKLLILLFSILISINSYGEEINSLFGIDLYDNAENYVSSNYIDSNKYKNLETIEGYFDLNITEKIIAGSPYFSEYWMTIDNNNNIHKIYGHNVLKNLDICQAVKENLSSTLEKRYQIEFVPSEDSYPTFKIYSNYHYNSQDDYLSIQCKEKYEVSTGMLQMYLNTHDYGVAINKFYNTGL